MIPPDVFALALVLGLLCTVMALAALAILASIGGTRARRRSTTNREVGGERG